MNTLFVYGSLRRDMAAGEAIPLLEGTVPIGRASIRGTLYDNGDYPALQRSTSGDEWVHGELIEIVDEQLRRIDEYEGCSGDGSGEFVRERCYARRSDGQWCDAFVYVFNNDVAGLRRVPGGDWAAHRRGREVADETGDKA